MEQFHLLADHKESQHRIRKCLKCDFVASSEFALTLHYQNDHSRNVKSFAFPCSFCGTTFDEIEDLRIHVSNRHQTPKPVDQEDSKMLMQESLDMFDEVKRIRKSVFQGFQEIMSNQEAMSLEINRIC